MSLRFVLQFMAGLLLVAGAVGMLASALSVKGFGGPAIYSGLVAAVLIGVGILVALDAMLFIHPEEGERDHAESN